MYEVCEFNEEKHIHINSLRCTRTHRKIHVHIQSYLF
jgi:hypothetical protein